MARQVLGLPAHKTLILVGAQRVTDFYKGFSLFFNAINKMNRHDLDVVNFCRDTSAGLASLDVGHTELGLNAFLRLHFLQVRILGFELLHALHGGGIYAAELASPPIDHGLATPRLPSQVREGHAGLVLLQNGHNRLCVNHDFSIDRS